MMVAEERRLPAAEAVEGDRHRDGNVDADHSDLHALDEIARRVAIAFDYRGDTVYFGEGLDESEASFIVERLKTRHAFR